MSNQYRSTLLILMILNSLSPSSAGGYQENHPDLLKNGYIKVGSSAYVKERASGAGFEYFFEGARGKLELLSYLNKELANGKAKINTYSPSNKSSDKAREIERRNRGIENLLNSLRTIRTH